MKKLKPKRNDQEWQIFIEQSAVSDLTKEILQALIEVKKMRTGELRPLTIKDI